MRSHMRPGLPAHLPILCSCLLCGTMADCIQHVLHMPVGHAMGFKGPSATAATAAAAAAWGSTAATSCCRCDGGAPCAQRCCYSHSRKRCPLSEGWLGLACGLGAPQRRR